MGGRRTEKKKSGGKKADLVAPEPKPEAEESSSSDETESGSDAEGGDPAVEAAALDAGESASKSGSESESESESHSESDGSKSSGTEDDVDNADDKADGEADPAPSSSLPPGDESCSFDLRNLTALNPHQIDSKSLYSGVASSSPGASTIDVGATLPNEEQLLQTASDGCAQLLKRLWTLDMERTDVGMLARLPGNEEIRTPRALPPPPPKVETKWEKFAKERGIAPKEKRSRKVWDEATQSWMYRHGYQRANDKSKEWPIMEVKDGDDPFADPWEEVREEKRAKVEKNTENRMRNQERAGMLAKGTATRTMKAQKKIREAGKAGGAKGVAVPPSGVPIDIRGDVKRGKDLTKAALLATQTSTASLGKFDKMREGEPERRRANMGLKKRKFDSATPSNQSKGTTESNRNARVLKNVLAGGGKEKERAIRKGEYARGETAYDHEYDDGLGASSFKKRKGRAGAGKMKKMTKKRVR